VSKVKKTVVETLKVPFKPSAIPHAELPDGGIGRVIVLAKPRNPLTAKDAHRCEDNQVNQTIRCCLRTAAPVGHDISTKFFAR
jgi:hypothetical protein